MAGRISCCLNLPLIDSNSSKSSSPLPKTTSHISFWRRRTENKTESPQNNNCSLPLAMAAAFVIAAVQISDVAAVESAVVKPPAKETAPPRWSDKRACPPWLQNSLETIVPENLPRPSSHRRLELAGLGKRDAPPIGAVVTRGDRGGCFSV